ncbi:MAG: cation-transporting P-type ATPase [Candidatus Nanohalobium sp.]
MSWHSEKIREIYEKLDTGKEGLSNDEAEQRLEEEGRNETLIKLNPTSR